ncbi:MAG TPA: response regulator, partial [Thermoanaerobaculia bacterium]|nr:response regulator [Thermoanaerobaculia bacterium]
AMTSIRNEPAAVARDRYEPLVLIAAPGDPVRDDIPRVTRPVAERELVEAIETALGVRTAPVLVPSEMPRAGAPLRVLLAEDHPVSQEFAAEALRRLGHEVVLVSDGEQALQALQNGLFDAVLMDVQMPRLDGVEATRRFRQTERGRRTPIIAVTAYIRPEDQTRCLDAGMDAVLMKPVRREELDEVLRALAPSDPIISAVGGDVKLLARVSDAFAKQTPPLLLSIRGAIESRDSFTLAQSAHKLKGSVSNFIGSAAFDFARQIEQCARMEDFDRATALLPILEEAIADLQRRMSAALE